MNIKTERLNIRRVVKEDWKSISRIWADQIISRYACYDKPKDTNPDIVRTKIERWASYADSMEHMFFAVCLEDTIIGYVAFNQRERGYETGYCFLSEYHGKGYAKESLMALISDIQNKQPGVIITAGTALNNTPSVKLLQSLGFCLVGTEQVSFYKDADGQDIYFDGGIFELANKGIE